jgi:hypothetical protein
MGHMKYVSCKWLIPLTVITLSSANYINNMTTLTVITLSGTHCFHNFLTLIVITKAAITVLTT